jgi:Uma2 family endonuclease
MGFIPDITVQERDWYRDRLVVGVDDDNADLAARAAEIKAYMDKSRVPEGLLVSPTHFRVYRNMYGRPPDAVTEVADFPTERVMGRLPSQTQGPEFEDFVQRWLERLQAEFLNGRIVLPPDVREVVEWEIMPQLYVGEIGATGPRWPTVAS